MSSAHIYLHRVSGLMTWLVCFPGTRTGQRSRLPVSFVRGDDMRFVLSAVGGSQVQNLCQQASCAFLQSIGKYGNHRISKHSDSNLVSVFGTKSVTSNNTDDESVASYSQVQVALNLQISFCFHYQVTYSNNNDRSLPTRFCDLEIFIVIIIKSDNNKAKFNIQGS